MVKCEGWASSLSTGHTLPWTPPDHRRRDQLIRPLAVIMLRLVRPLFSHGLPASCGGGKSRFRGIDTHLHRQFKRLFPQFLHQIPHLQLRPADDIARRSAVDRIGNLLHDPPALRLHLRHIRRLVHRLETFHDLPPAMTPVS